MWNRIRKPLLGRTWLIRKESSSLAQLGSRKRISRTLTPAEKKIEYKTPFHDQNVAEISGRIVEMEQPIGGRTSALSKIKGVGTGTRGDIPVAESLLTGLAGRRSPGIGTGIGDGTFCRSGNLIKNTDLGDCIGRARAGAVELVDVQDMSEVLRDSGTGSNNTPSTFCSDSGGANNNNDNVNSSRSPTYHDAIDPNMLSVVPIPVFMSQQYRMELPSDKNNRRVRRICSSASARAASSRLSSEYSKFNTGENPGNLSPAEISGRRHSWCCTLDNIETKHYKTQSTQTFKAESPTSTKGNANSEASETQTSIQDIQSIRENEQQILSPQTITSNDSYYTSNDKYSWGRRRCECYSSDQFSSQFTSESIPEVDYDDDEAVFVYPNSTKETVLSDSMDKDRENKTLFNFTVHTSTPMHRSYKS